MSQFQLRHRYRLESVNNGAISRFYERSTGNLTHEYSEEADGLLHMSLEYTLMYGVEGSLVMAGARTVGGRSDLTNLAPLLESLHRDFGHVNVQQLGLLAQATSGREIPDDIFRAALPTCTSCLMAKRCIAIHSRRRRYCMPCHRVTLGMSI